MFALLFCRPEPALGASHASAPVFASERFEMSGSGRVIIVKSEVGPGSLGAVFALKGCPPEGTTGPSIEFSPVFGPKRFEMSGSGRVIIVISEVGPG